MKKKLRINFLSFSGIILSVIFLVFGSQKIEAQLINPGFETWTTDLAVPTAMNPNNGNATTGWVDYNFFNSSLVGSSPLSIFRCDTAHSGNYSARIQTQIYTTTSWNIYKAWGIPFIGHIYSDTLGILFDGNLNETNQKYVPGIPCTQKLSTFSFYYQYAPQGGDTAECRVLLVKQRNAVGGGLVKINTATGPNWQQATINFIYVDTVSQPDTLYILFSSSSLDKNPKPGSVFWVDDASVTVATGINNLQASNDIAVFPNPTTGKINLMLGQSTNIETKNIELYNMYGDKVYSTHINSSQSEIDLSKQKSGIYFMKIYSGDAIITKEIEIIK